MLDSDTLHKLDRSTVWPIQRNVASMRVLCQLAENHGVSLADCLRNTQVSIAQLNDPYAQVSAQQELQLIDNILAAKKHTEHYLGLEAGGYYHLNTFGIWGFALVNSPTLRDAIDLGLRYLDLTFAFNQVHRHEQQDDIWLILDDSAIPISSRQFLLDRDLSSIMTMVEELFNYRPLLKKVCFKYPAPKDLSMYQKVFGITPEFNAPYHGVCFAKSFLDMPIPQSNPHTAAMCEAQCRELLRRQHQRSGTAAKVRDFLLIQPQAMPSMEEVATHLCMSSRTLRRHLTAEQVSYRLLADEVRMTLAEELLKIPNLTLEEIAIRIGYSEVSNFLHAFKRCKQQTPSKFRKQLGLNELTHDTISASSIAAKIPNTALTQDKSC